MGSPFDVLECRVCGAVFLSPVPTPIELQHAYCQEYYGRGQRKFQPLLQRLLDGLRKGRMRLIRRIVSPPARILDVGCGDGQFIAALRQVGFNAYGLELPGHAAERAAQRCGTAVITAGSFRSGLFSASAFDMVTLWHVLEHLPEPQVSLAVLREIVKPGGYALLALPNIDSLQSQIFQGNWLHLDPPRHLCLLPRRCLHLAMAREGFRLVYESSWSLEQNPYGIQQSLLNCGSRKRDFLLECLRGNVEGSGMRVRLVFLLQFIFLVATFPAFAVLAALESAADRGGTMTMIYQKSGGG
jgi:SAM-dependent methyltransferase